ncbi:MAG: 30S ribosomal protein S17 [Candidatus Amesbacteria bacterium GW2011_GWA2_47_11b]|uniref:Small ribosomal subunit protein uS17 n=3 Tax=Candidatus Amesiibacteriota TaxID=1752730 RepID=A0A0G1SKE4_9BACT|nr:MAG: 30S ribosomal protein S17 [Microgenomates group bacterium GW2011_GWC1_46_20]KKU57655.1 MAG: 30S ribosomal protein S17 [Candidatus Amesbacteria bacterium GW2011_GWA2_47_11b]KKU69964.1 MAG: 30S ribosomal protein S17 [Candidatus Amesbacteria bacterium GW2011_GWA1_47_20]KKU84070.1 MAG: 30S ribosomal protein S17 [Candidatus Amesbacteria bacterium GW2011_GWC2_47_8]
MKILSGKVVSNKMAKTVVVEVDRFVTHPMYHKRIKRTQKFHAHDEQGVKIGDVVKIAEVKPISRTKTWKIV